MTTMRFHNTLSGRMLLLGVLPTAAVLLGIIVWLASAFVTELRAENEHDMQILADRVASEIERGNTRAVLIAQVMAHAQENGMFGRREESVAYARQILESYPELTGSYFGYEPDADGADAAAKAETSSIDTALSPGGRFIPYWFRAHKDNALLKLEPLVDMESSLYYQGCKELFFEAGGARAMVTEPYVYEGKMIVEQTYPIVIDGQFSGIAGVDRALSDIETFLQQIKARYGVDVFLVSRAGKFVAATTEVAGDDETTDAQASGETAAIRLRTRLISESPYQDLFGPFYESRDQQGFLLAMDPVDEERHYYASAHVRTGDWMVVIRNAESTVTAPIREKILPILLIVAIGLVVVAALAIWVSRTTSARIQRAVLVADRMAMGDVTVDAALDTDARDETGLLYESFNRLVSSYRAITRMCVAIAEGDFSQTFSRRSEKDELAVALNEMSRKRQQAERDVLAARDTAEGANRAKSEFLAKMSHELRTPMNAIIGYSEMLEEEAEESDQDEFIPDLQKIQAAGRHLLALINDILDLSKVEAGKMDLYLERFDVAEMIREVTTTIQPLAQKNANRLEISCAEDVGEIEADLVKIRQGLFNLLSNACKFTREGTVELSARRVRGDDGERMIFSVTDSGIGMTEAEMGRIFEAFGQADDSTTRQFGGTGLGLTITKRFCEMMGGSIDVSSEKGGGSTFTIEIPVEAPLRASHENADDEQEVGKLGTSGPEAGPLVLVVDDDANARTILSRILSKEGYRIAEAQTGEEALEIAASLHPIAITLDVMMPGMDGWAVLSRLKNDPLTANIPVLMCTILRDDSIAFSLGAAEFLTKPVDRQRLLHVLANAQGERDALVVEDDPDSRDLVVRLLQQAGWTVRCAEDGRQGLERIAEREPSLILLDLMMPIMDGFEFLSELRDHPKWRSLPVIVLTAKELTASEQDFLENLAQRVITKGGSDRSDLLDALSSVVDAGA